MKKSKRVLILSDLHCGHQLGLTPPKYQNHFREIQNIGWNFYAENVNKLGPVDLCILGGDLVDGPARKGSTQHIATDMLIQQKIAMECLEQVKTKKMVFVRGTPFHTQNDMEYEDAVAAHFNSDIFR